MRCLGSPKSNYFLSGALAAVAALLGTPRQASAADATDSQLVEIVVTAQRRSENLQNVPISAVVVGGVRLAEQNLIDLQSLSQTMPSLHVSAAGATSDMYIRGIGSGTQQAFDQSVGTFIDDIYHGRARSSVNNFFDLERIEILKGPQSTFFGNNAIAGALNIVTNKPTEAFEASARALYGMFGQYTFEGAVGGPINDVLSVRVAGMIDGGDGWIKNINTSDYEPGEYNDGARITLALKPSQDFDATLKVEASRNRQRGDLYLQVLDCPPPRPFSTGAFCGSALAQHVPTYTIGNIGNEEADAAGGGTFLSNVETELTMNFHRWEHTFTSVTGYYKYNYSQNLDLSATPAALATIAAPENYYQVSQEFRVASATNQTIEYLAGAYFQTDHLNYSQVANYPFFNGPIEGIPPFAPLVPYLPISQAFVFSQPEHVYSLFGSATWNVTDRWKLTAGLRATSDEKSYSRTVAYGTGTQVYGGFVPLPPDIAPLAGALLGTPPGAQSGSATDRPWMPSAKLQYEIDPKAMLYFSYARGFKAGGFNGSDTTGVAANIPYQPEHVNAYEGGLKSQWLNDTVLLNIDVFRSDYTNLQVVVEEGYTTGTSFAIVRNAAASRSQGIEYEGQWVASEHFRLAANITYLDSYYVDYPNAAPSSLQQAQGLEAQDLSGRQTEYAPLWSGTVTGTFTAKLPNDYRITADLMPYFTSPYYLIASEDAPGRQSQYVRLDARLSLESPDRHWGVDLIGKNLTNREILNIITIYPTSAGSYLVDKQPGANVAIQARYRW
jgi:iron complex outermembrane recepter protein